MKTVTVTIEISINETKHSIDFETGNDLQDTINEYLEENEIEQEYDIDSEGYEVTDWPDVEEFENLCDIAVLNEIADCSDLDSLEWDVISAGIECGIDIDNIAEAYAGQYSNDAEFAEETAEQTCDIDFRNLSWPLTCINWEQAARELMYDYSEANGYYFRNF